MSEGLRLSHVVTTHSTQFFMPSGSIAQMRWVPCMGLKLPWPSIILSCGGQDSMVMVTASMLWGLCVYLTSQQGRNLAPLGT